MSKTGNEDLSDEMVRYPPHSINSENEAQFSLTVMGADETGLELTGAELAGAP